jgi:hypothetical protein
MLARQVAREKGGAEHFFSRQNVWLWAAALGIPLGVMFAWAEIRLFADLYGNGFRSTLLVTGPEFFFFTLHGAIALHHFDIEAFAWRFGDQSVGPELRARLAGW